MFGLAILPTFPSKNEHPNKHTHDHSREDSCREIDSPTVILDPTVILVRITTYVLAPGSPLYFLAQKIGLAFLGTTA